MTSANARRHGIAFHHAHSDHHVHMSGPAWLPVVLAILLGTAAMVAGLIAWRAAVHSGDAQGEFALSTQAVNNANSLQQNASQAVISERSLFIAYEDAVAQHDGPHRRCRGLMDPPTLRSDRLVAGPIAGFPTFVAVLGGESRVDDASEDHRCTRCARRVGRHARLGRQADPPVAQPRAARSDPGDRVPHRWSDRDAPVRVRAVDPARGQRRGLGRRRRGTGGAVVRGAERSGSRSAPRCSARRCWPAVGRARRPRAPKMRAAVRRRARERSR